MTMYRPPAPVVIAPGTCAVFLAGSIEMGTADDWQTALAKELGDVAILNPRREDWDASWRQSIEEQKFREQVEWELDSLDRADVIAMRFAPETKSPITLLELGLHARSGKLVVGCPEGFWRRGNIEVVCARFAIPLYAEWAPFVAAVTSKLCT